MNAENAPLEGGAKGDIDNALPYEGNAKAEKPPHQDSRKFSRELPTDNATQADKLDGEDIAMLPPEFQKEVRDTLAKEAAAKAKPKSEKSTK